MKDLKDSYSISSFGIFKPQNLVYVLVVSVLILALYKRYILLTLLNIFKSSILLQTVM